MKLRPHQVRGLALAQWNREHMQRTGHTPAGQLVWTSEEVETVVRLYPDYAALFRALPHRTPRAVQRKVAKLRISKPRSVWATTEFRTVAGPYRKGVPIDEVVALTDGKTKDQVWGKAGREGVRRPRRPPKLTGVRVVDEVRRRAFDLSFTMRELAEEAGANTFLTAKGQVRWGAVAKAVGALGGRFDVRWPI